LSRFDVILSRFDVKFLRQDVGAAMGAPELSLVRIHQI